MSYWSNFLPRKFRLVVEVVEIAEMSPSVKGENAVFIKYLILYASSTFLVVPKGSISANTLSHPHSCNFFLLAKKHYFAVLNTT